MTHWQEHPQLSPLSFKQPSFAYTQPPHIKVSASLLPHKQPPWNVWPPLPAPSPPMQHVMPVPDPASPPTHWNLDSYPVEDDWGSETLQWLHVGDHGARWHTGFHPKPNLGIYI